MALAVVQTKTGATTAITATTVAATWSGNTTSGNLIIVGLAGGIQHVSSITDSQGNTYTVADTGHFSFSMCEIWYAKNITGGTTPTVTATLASGEPATIHLYEVSGADTTSPLDVHANASGNGVTANTPTVTSGATSNANDIVFAVGGVFLGAGTDAFSVGAGYTDFTSTNSTPTVGITVSSGAEDKIVSATGAQTATFGLSFTSATWEITLATFKQAPVVDSGGARSVRIPNRFVGPMALRRIFRQPYVPQSSPPPDVVNASITQVAANVTVTGGTQTITNVRDVAITQVAATVTATGGTQTVTANVLVNASITQVAAAVTVAGGTQAITTVQNSSITQVHASVTVTGGTQTIASQQAVSITQVAANVTVTGGTQTTATFRSVSIAQIAATVTVTGGLQAVRAITPPRFVFITKIINSITPDKSINESGPIANVTSSDMIESVDSPTNAAGIEGEDPSKTIGTTDTNKNID